MTRVFFRNHLGRTLYLDTPLGGAEYVSKTIANQEVLVGCELGDAKKVPIHVSGQWVVEWWEQPLEEAP